MTFADTVTSVATRFLTERSFELIVAPALADFELDTQTGVRGAIAARAAVLRALLGAAWDDVVRGGDLALFAGLVLIPVGYYTFFFLLGLPAGADRLSVTAITLLGFAVVLLSLAPAIVCFWPDREHVESGFRRSLRKGAPGVSTAAGAQE